MRDHYNMNAKIAELILGIKNFESLIDQIEQEKKDLENELVNEVLAFKDILNETTWQYDSGNDNVLLSRYGRHKTFVELLCNYNHSTIRGKEVSLFFDEDCISLLIEPPQTMIEFIRKYDIQLEIDSLKKVRDKLRTHTKNHQQELLEIEKKIGKIEVIINDLTKSPQQQNNNPSL